MSFIWCGWLDKTPSFSKGVRGQISYGQRHISDRASTPAWGTERGSAGTHVCHVTSDGVSDINDEYDDVYEKSRLAR